MAQQPKGGGKSKKDASSGPVLPDRKTHEDELDLIGVQIQEKQAALKALGRPGLDRDAQKETNAERDGLRSEQGKLRSRKDACTAKRRDVDKQIHDVHEIISKKSEEANKMVATFRYKTEERVDAALERLEKRKQSTQLSAQEKTDLETEIADLTSSKPKIVAYNALRAEIEVERQGHGDLRTERDATTVELSEIRAAEDDLHARLNKSRGRQDQEKLVRKSQQEERDAVNRELDDLYTQRREKIAAFRQAQSDFHRRELDARDAAFAKRDEERRKAREERALEREGRQKEQLEYEAASDPNLALRQTCSSLVTYLKRMVATDSNGAASSGSPDSATADLDSLTPVRDGGQAKAGVFLSRKSREDEFESSALFSGMAAKGKKAHRNRKSGAASAAKAAGRPVKHNTVVIQQFLSVGVLAPNSVAAATTALSQLQEKEAHYAQLLQSKYGKGGATTNGTSSSSSSAAGAGADSAAPEASADTAIACNGDGTHSPPAE